MSNSKPIISGRVDPRALAALAKHYSPFGFSRSRLLAEAVKDLVVLLGLPVPSWPETIELLSGLGIDASNFAIQANILTFEEEKLYEIKDGKFEAKDSNNNLTIEKLFNEGE